MKYKVEICKGPYCSGKASPLIRAQFESLVKSKQLEKNVRVDGGGCWGLCTQAPNVCVISKNGNTFYNQVTLDMVNNIFKFHILRN